MSKRIGLATAFFCRVLLERIVGLFLQLVSLELSIKLVKLAELFKYSIDSCHLQASLCQPGPASSPSTA